MVGGGADPPKASATKGKGVPQHAYIFIIAFSNGVYTELTLNSI
jgi:hypothetical protein